jgi:hypothetical protein
MHLRKKERGGESAEGGGEKWLREKVRERERKEM